MMETDIAIKCERFNLNLLVCTYANRLYLANKEFADVARRNIIQIISKFYENYEEINNYIKFVLNNNRIDYMDTMRLVLEDELFNRIKQVIKLNLSHMKGTEHIKYYFDKGYLDMKEFIDEKTGKFINTDLLRLLSFTNFTLFLYILETQEKAIINSVDLRKEILMDHINRTSFTIIYNQYLETYKKYYNPEIFTNNLLLDFEVIANKYPYRVTNKDNLLFIQMVINKYPERNLTHVREFVNKWLSKLEK